MDLPREFPAPLPLWIHPCVTMTVVNNKKADLKMCIIVFHFNLTNELLTNISFIQYGYII